MTLQQDSEAKFDSVLTARMSAHLLNISDDILGEATSTPNHYFRRAIILACKYKNSTRQSVAQAMLSTALSNDAFTLPIVVTGDPPEQVQPTDTEIENAINGYMANAALLCEIVSAIL